jgi:prephenate dehydrogenase
MQCVAIVGTGLIGASFGLALKAAGFNGSILGVSSPAAAAEALECGAIDEVLPLEAAVPQADWVFLAQTISRILETIPRLEPLVRPTALITDAGSTKRRIVARAQAHLSRGLFLGAHPMAGKEARGARAAEATLFAGRPYLLTPEPAATGADPRVAEFVGWVRAIGARPIVLTPERHDRLVAAVSHLPQLASTAMAAALEQMPDHAEFPAVAGPGLVDSTRLALSSFEVWGDILATNADSIDACLAMLEANIARLRASLRAASLEPDFNLANRFARRLRPSDQPAEG